MVGENTTLHCHLSPERNAEDMEVRWFRWRFSLAVLVYRGHQERPEEQMVAYRGRTTFMSTDISKGRVALTIHNVSAYDDGIYCCYFQEGRSYDQATMKLTVASKSLCFPPLTFPSVIFFGGRGGFLSSIQAHHRLAHFLPVICFYVGRVAS